MIAARPTADRVSRRHAVVALLGLGVGLSAVLPLPEAQSAAKVYRIGLILTVAAKRLGTASRRSMMPCAISPPERVP
jgi:hypothetical protein